MQIDTPATDELVSELEKLAWSEADELEKQRWEERQRKRENQERLKDYRRQQYRKGNRFK